MDKPDNKKQIGTQSNLQRKSKKQYEDSARILILCVLGIFLIFTFLLITQNV